MNCLRMLVLMCLLSGCSSFPFEGQPDEATLAELPAVVFTTDEETIPPLDLSELAAAYREALVSNADPVIRLQVEHRLANIALLQGEAQLAEDETGETAQFFAQSITAYEALLQEHPDNPLNDQLLYQMSKAYALGGSMEKSVAALERLTLYYPESSHRAEAEFRKAESYFVAADYNGAEQSYTTVISFGDSTPYYLNALYMQGWSRFKRGDYDSAIASFTTTLDQVMPVDNDLDAMPRGEREMAQDGMRVLAVIFSYLDGAESITQAYDRLGVRPYQFLLYEELGNLYLSQERYRDSAEAYKSYASRFPDSSYAPRFQLRVIESYEAGGFPDLVVEEKEHYVENFAVAGSYWQSGSEDQRAEIRPHLKQFIEELASFHHALAQNEVGQKGQQAVARKHYLAAGNYYQLFIDSFPEDTRVPSMGFLLGESRFEVDDYRGAIDAYEWVAYEFSDYERAADAAYAAILAYELLSANGAAEIDLSRIASERRFAATFDTDVRAVPVLEHASAALLQLERYEEAIDVSSSLIHWQPTPATDIVTSAWLVQGHSLFELRRHGEAEQAYQSALSGMAENHGRHDATVERVAASIYRQGEEAVTAGDHLAAAGQFARVMSEAPQSKIRLNAQYDAAVNYIQAGELEQANGLLNDFRSRYPDHALTDSVTVSLVSNYEQLEQWQAAANELDRIAQEQPAAEEQRQALYLAASYYDRAEAKSLAVERYTLYANQWPKPVDLRMEAMNRLAQLYEPMQQSQKRRTWLREMVDTHERAGAEQSERTLYLAAESSSSLADDDYQVFSGIKLGYPIKKSLRQKKTAMERALAAYQNTQSYGVEQFSTLATYRIGRIYQQLSTDLLASERPGNINELALEEYEMLLEELAYPFEEKAIAIYETNTQRSRDGLYDEWVQHSFTALGELLPARYYKMEASIGFNGEIY